MSELEIHRIRAVIAATRNERINRDLWEENPRNTTLIENLAQMLDELEEAVASLALCIAKEDK